MPGDNTAIAQSQTVLLTVRDTARRLSLCEKSVRNLIAAGELRAIRVGRAVRLSPQDIAAFIEKARSAGGATW